MPKEICVARKEFHIKFAKKALKQVGGNIIVWDRFSWEAVGFKDVLETVMLAKICHSFGMVKEWFRENKVDVVNRPDLNPIEIL